MKKIAFVMILALISATSFGQVKVRVGHERQSAKSNPETVTETKPELKLDLNNPSTYHVVYGRINNNDTLLYVLLPEVNITLLQHYYEFANTRQGKRLVRNVRKVYPYAKEAGLKLQEYDSVLSLVNSNKVRRQMMKAAEDQISAQYTEELKKLTFSQGAILIRLIDRETGNTSYKVVQSLRGKLRAVFYQGFARLWGYNLKSEYDPVHNQEDDQIETIVKLLDEGVI